MQTLTRPNSPENPNPGFKGRSNRRFSPLVLIGSIVTLLIVVGAGIFFFVQPHFGSHAAAPVANPDCALIVPPNPLTAQGLATPYQLLPQDAANGPCNEKNAMQTAFVQAAVIDPATGQISVYNPLVIDQGTQPAAPTVVPQLPANGVVAIWFGSNGSTLKLINSQGSLKSGICVNGARGTLFGQFSYCNAPAFFTAANAAIAAGKLTPPALGTAKNGLACPTVRDFSIVDQDQSDNLPTTYLLAANGQTAQMNAVNAAMLKNVTAITNGSDNRLLDVAVDGALGCAPWKAPDLADPGQMVPSLPLNELQAAADQKAPVAIVPALDPMTTNNGKISLTKVNAYRLGVDQLPAANQNDANTNIYCQNMLDVGLPRIIKDAPLTVKSGSPDPAAGDTLFTFLAQRFVASFGADNLNCVQLLGIKDPLAVNLDANQVAISATLNGQLVNTQTGTGTGTGNGGVTVAPDCNFNNTTVKGCMGTTTLNGQTCTVAFANNIVTVSCPNGQTNPGGPTTNPGGPVAQAALPFNNTGTSNDGSSANFDNSHYSYSAQALQNVGLTPGKMLTFNGVNFTWPSSAVGIPDNVQAQGQVIPVTSVKNATTLAFLGSATFGPSMGAATITYTDGSTQAFTLGFSDWTLNGGVSAPLAGNQVVAVMPYRNTGDGGRQMQQMPNVFYTDVALQAGKTIQSVTLPANASHGAIHIFAISTK